MKNVSVIVPAYNEEKKIESVLKEIKSLGVRDIVVVDDGSKDRTYRIASRHARVIRVPENKGKGNACRVGALSAKHENLVFIDADGQLSPGDIPSFLNALKNCELVIGRRAMQRVPLQRRLANSFARFMIRKITKSDLGDCLCGLRAIRKKDFLKLDLKKDRYEIESEMLIKAARRKFRIKDMPVTVRYRDYKGMPVLQSLRVTFYLIKQMILS